MIETVLGPIEATALGPCDYHDHLFIAGGLPVVLEPGFRLDDADAAIAEVTDFQQAGGGSMVDCMPIGVGRDIISLIRVAQATGLQLIAATGFHKDRYYAADHWARSYGVDQITELLVAEARDGIDAYGYSAPRIERTSAKAGIIKIGSSLHRLTRLEEKLFAAAGAAAVETGLPVITHTDSGTCGPEQLERLAKEGLPASRVVLSHMDRNPDPVLHRDLASAGGTLCFDWLGRVDRRPDAVIADLVVAAAESGYLDRVVLGQDMARRSYWRTLGGGPGLRHLFASFVPRLRAAGLSEADLTTLLVSNPQRQLDITTEVPK
jgi:phosphotriesterase-related protein